MSNICFEHICQISNAFQWFQTVECISNEHEWKPINFTLPTEISITINNTAIDHFEQFNGNKPT